MANCFPLIGITTNVEVAKHDEHVFIRIFICDYRDVINFDLDDLPMHPKCVTPTKWEDLFRTNVI